MSFVETFIFWNSTQNVQYFRDKPADPRVKKRLQELKSKNDQQLTALDLGCGGGRHTELLVELGFETYAADPNPRMLRCTRDRVGSHVLKGLKRASIKRLPYTNSFFDAVVVTGVLHQAKGLNEYERAISELSRVLKVGGVVCLNIFTSTKLDSTYTRGRKAFLYKTVEGLEMTLLSKSTFYDLMNWYGLQLEQEISGDVVQENTGERSVLRCNFIKN